MLPAAKKTICFLLASFFFFPAPNLVRADTETLALRHFALPESLGKIQDRFVGTSPRTVVQIQDVHGHVTAQENIAAILDHLQAVYGVSTVAIEGAWKTSSLPETWGVPNSRAKQQIARKLLEDGYLSGPPYAAIFAPMPMTLVGIEEENLYRENKSFYLTYLGREQDIQKTIAVVDAGIEAEKDSVYNASLRSFDKQLTAFHDGTKAESFLSSLVARSKELQIDLLNFAQIALFDKILETTALINQDKLKLEAQQIAQKYRYDRLSFEELLRSGKIPAEDLALYTEVQHYQDLLTLQDKLDHHEFILQIESLAKQIKGKLAASDAEKKLDGQSDLWLLLKKLLNFKATPKDFTDFLGAEAAVTEMAASHQLSEALETSKKFYVLAKERDDAFFKRITSDEKLSTDIAVVTGGFHTDGLSAKLREAGISYVVVTPDLANTAPNEAMYHKMLNLEIADSETLAPEVPLSKKFDRALAAVINEASTNPRVDTTGVADKVFGALLSARKTPAPLDQDVQTPAAMSDERLKAFLDENFQTLTRSKDKPALPANQKLVLLLSTGELAELTKNPEGAKYWNLAYQNQDHIIFLMNNDAQGMLPDALTDAITTSPGNKTLRLVRAEDLNALVGMRQVQPILKHNTGRVAALSNHQDEVSDKDLLLLPVEPVSLLLFQIVLRNDALRAMAATPEGFARIKAALLALESVQAFLKSA